MAKKNNEQKNEKAGYKLSKADKVITKGNKALVNIFINADIHGKRIPSKELMNVEFSSKEPSTKKGEKKRGNKVRKMKKAY